MRKSKALHPARQQIAAWPGECQIESESFSLRATNAVAATLRSLLFATKCFNRPTAHQDRFVSSSGFLTATVLRRHINFSCSCVLIEITADTKALNSLEVN
jgi:hypothetical protein